MLLTIDAGNTNIVVSVFDGAKQLVESRVDTNAARMSDQYAIMLSEIMRLYEIESKSIAGAIISSVVPPVTRNIVSAVKRLTGAEPLLVCPGIKSGLNIKIDNPAELGADLVCGAVAAKNMYDLPCIAIDMGTVTKVTAIDGNGTLIGVTLAPGVGTGFRTMAETTTTLPLVDAGEVKSVLGTNSADSIRSGIIIGTACMLDGLIERFEDEIGGKCSVVVTGGFSETVAPYCKREIVLNKSLVSEGLRIIYGKNII